MIQPMLGKGMRADYSPINQAWIIRPYSPDWTPEVQLMAPVLRVTYSETEARDIVGGL